MDIQQEINGKRNWRKLIESKQQAIQWEMGQWRNQKEKFKFPELKENKNTIYPKVSDAVKVDIKENFIVLTSYI